MLKSLLLCFTLVSLSSSKKREREQKDGEGDPLCENGLVNNEACCLASCGSCGGDGCSQRPGGSENCCHGSITRQGDSCHDFDAPCVIGPPPRRRIINMRGQNTFEDGYVTVNGSLKNTSLCFKVDIYNYVKNDNVKIGEGFDCLYPTGSDDCGIELWSDTTFKFNNGDSITLHGGRTSVLALKHSNMQGPYKDFTHETAAMPHPYASMSGTGKYDGVDGEARLAGLVNMTNFNPANPAGPNNYIYFDCVFTVDID